MILVMGVSIYTASLVLHVLGLSDYGLYTIVAGVVSMFGFFNAAMSSATQRFLSYDIGKNDFLQLRRTFNATLNIHIGIAIFVLILAETVGLWFVNNKLNIALERIEAIQWIYQFSIFSLVIGIVQVPYNALTIARERMGIYAIISVVEVGLKLGIAYFLIVVSFDKLILHALLMSSVTFLVAIIYILYCHQAFSETQYQFYFNKAYYKTLLSYSGWNLFGNIAGIAKIQGINMTLNLFFGTTLNAAYGLTLQVQGAVSLIAQNFQLAFNPQIVKSYASNEGGRTVKLIMESSKFSFFLMLLLTLPVIYNVNFILSIWLKTVPDYTSEFVVLCLINILVDCISGSLMTGIQATGIVKWYQIVVGIAIFLNLPVSYIALETFKTPSVVFYVSIIISLIALVLRMHFMKLVSGFNLVSYFKNVILKVVLVTLSSLSFSCIALSYSTFDNQLSKFINSSLLIGFATLLSILVLGLKREELKYIIVKIKARVF